MVIKKRCLLWDWTNTAHMPEAIERINFNGALSSCANWNAWAPPELQGRLPFRPTVRGLEQLTSPQEWAMIQNNDHAILHFFNEPERAGISPRDAVRWWCEKMVPLRKATGKQIIGPGCASDAEGEAWLAAFMEGVEAVDEPPDYLGVHYYGARRWSRCAKLPGSRSSVRAVLAMLRARHGSRRSWKEWRLWTSPQII
jgi:hypothetical protein